MSQVDPYKLRVWKSAMDDAEAAVMRTTATQIGGRLKGEGLMDYVERANRNQGIAIANWMTAKAEYESALAATSSAFSQSAEQPRVIVERINPPIPVRSHDYRATFDGYEPGDPMGVGATEEDAISDLLGSLKG